MSDTPPLSRLGAQRDANPERAVRSGIVSTRRPGRLSAVPSEWGDDTWTMHNVPAYRAMALEEGFDYWLRVWFFAVANVQANGHAPLGKGVLAHALGGVIDGVWVAAPSGRVSEAITTCKAKGLIAPQSKARCLIPMGNIVHMGKGDPDRECTSHPTMRVASRRRAG